MEKDLKQLIDHFRAIVKEDILEVRVINGEFCDYEMVKEALTFDNEETCYSDQTNDLSLNARMFLMGSTIYGIFLNFEFIGTIGAYMHNPVDKTRLELCCCIKKEYRNKHIGETALREVIEKYLNDAKIKSIHVSIREDNIASQKLAEKLQFKEYMGYKDDALFVKSDGTKIKQKQYLLKLKDYKKK